MLLCVDCGCLQWAYVVIFSHSLEIEITCYFATKSIDEFLSLQQVRFGCYIARNFLALVTITFYLSHSAQYKILSLTVGTVVNVNRWRTSR